MKVTGRKGSDLKKVVFKKTGSVQGSPPASSSKPEVAGVEAAESVVAISDRGRSVSEARRMYEGVPDIPQVEKVEALHAAVDNGTYHVPGEKVADKMVKDAVREIRNRNR